MVFAHDLAREGRHVYLIGLTTKARNMVIKEVGAGILEIISIPTASYDEHDFLFRYVVGSEKTSRLGSRGRLERFGVMIPVWPLASDRQVRQNFNLRGTDDFKVVVLVLRPFFSCSLRASSYAASKLIG